LETDLDEDLDEDWPRARFPRRVSEFFLLAMHGK
jgi:hypothetical protein